MLLQYTEAEKGTQLQLEEHKFNSRALISRALYVLRCDKIRVLTPPQFAESNFPQVEGPTNCGEVCTRKLSQRDDNEIVRHKEHAKLRLAN